MVTGGALTGCIQKSIQFQDEVRGGVWAMIVLTGTLGSLRLFGSGTVNTASHEAFGTCRGDESLWEFRAERRRGEEDQLAGKGYRQFSRARRRARRRRWGDGGVETECGERAGKVAHGGRLKENKGGEGVKS